jgi:hypothetical protein
MSGVSMVLKNGTIDKRDNVRLNAMLSDTINNDDNHFLNYELMFNAYHEDTIMRTFYSKWGYFGATWHADSGGLQMITQNKTITPEWKDKIYRVQAEHSSYAMCFDEMPINLTDEATGSKVDLSGRQYIRDWAKEKAILTGLNVKRQIEVIREEKSSSKVFIICQGNTTQGFVNYYNNVMAQLPEDYYTSIAGVALSAACTGLGILESIKMVASYNYMHIPAGMGNKLHLLGFGSTSRLYPVMLLKSSGYINADITFDSSSHAMLAVMGSIKVTDSEVLKEDGRYEFPHETNGRSAETDNIYRHLFVRYRATYAKYFPQVSEDMFLGIMGYDHKTGKRYHKRRSPRHIIKKYNITTEIALTIQMYTRYLITYDSFTTFSKEMGELQEDINLSKESGIRLTEVDRLIDVKTTEDLERWMSDHSKYVPSNKIPSFANIEEATAAQKTLDGKKQKVVKVPKIPYTPQPTWTF